MIDPFIVVFLSDGSVQLMSRQVDDFLLACGLEEIAKQIFDTIGRKIQFYSEKERNIIPFEYLGDVKDYNGCDITQTPDYIEMSYGNYIPRLLKSHGWDTDSSKSIIPSEAIAVDNNTNTVVVCENTLDVSLCKNTRNVKLREHTRDIVQLQNNHTKLHADCESTNSSVQIHGTCSSSNLPTNQDLLNFANSYSESFETNNPIQSREMESPELNPESNTPSIEPSIEPTSCPK